MTRELLFHYHKYASWSYALSVQDFSCPSAKSMIEKAEDERKSKVIAYDNAPDSARRVGDKISLSRFRRRHQSSMSRFDSANLWLGRCADTQRSGLKRPRSYAHWVSAATGFIRPAQTAERSFFKNAASRVSTSEEAVLGTTLLGNRLRRVVNWQHYRWNGRAISGTSSARVKER